jgi:hypothetical protein
MTSPATQTGLTVRTFLLGGGSTEEETAEIRRFLSEHDVVSKCGGDLKRLTKQGREAAEEQLASVTAGLLDLDLGDLLSYGWRTRERLVEAARQTRRTRSCPARCAPDHLGPRAHHRAADRRDEGAYLPVPADRDL